MTLRTIALAALFAVVLPSASIAGAGDPPAAQAAKQKAVYDEKADAAKDIAAAVARAEKNHSRVLVQWGANWCGWCRLLHETCQSDKPIAKELHDEYEVVHVDVGRFDKHMDLAAKYGADLKKEGLPYLTVIGGDDKAVANQETASLELPKDAQAKGHDAAKVLAFLKANEAPRVKADDVLAAGIARAKAEGKLVFLHFGAPWCGWCHKLEAWMAKPEVAAILGNAFIDVKVDTDRMPGGQELLRAHSQGKNGGIPWFEFLDADGKALANSNAPKEGNVGFPAQAAEIAWFAEMLRASKARMSEKDISALTASLQTKPSSP